MIILLITSFLTALGCSEPDVTPDSCEDDRFGPSSQQNPGLRVMVGTIRDLVLCPEQSDWFTLEAGFTQVSLIGVGDFGLRMWVDGAVVAHADGTRPVLDVPRGLSGTLEVISHDLAEAAYSLEVIAESDDCEANGAAAIGTMRICAGGTVDIQVQGPTRLEARLVGSEGTLTVLVDQERPITVTSRVLAHVSATRLEIRVAEPLTIRISAVEEGELRLVASPIEAAAGGRVQGTLVGRDRPLTEAGFMPDTPMILPNTRIDVWSDDRLLSTGWTDEQGRFDLQWRIATRALQLRVQAVVWGPGQISVGQTLNAPWHWDIPFDVDTLPAEWVIELPIDEPITAALHAAQVATEGWEAAASGWLPTDVVPEPLWIRWQPDTAEGCGTCYRINGSPLLDLSGLQVDPDIWDDSVILHEFGHFLAATFSQDDGMGGRHNGGRALPKDAWSEGWASFFAAWVQGSPVLLDYRITGVQSRNIADLEAEYEGTSNGLAQGLVSEWLVAAVLWSLHDELTDAELFSPFLSLAGSMRGAAGIDLVDYLTALCEAGVDIEGAVGEVGFPYACELNP